MAVPLINRDNVTARLLAIGCTQVNVSLPDHTVWVTPWGFHFIVPHPPPEGMLTEWDFNRIIKQLVDSKPTYN